MNKYDAMVDVAKQADDNSHWCKFCNRHLKPTSKDGGMVFVHDDAYHPAGYVFENGDGHLLVVQGRDKRNSGRG